MKPIASAAAFVLTISSAGMASVIQANSSVNLVDGPYSALSVTCPDQVGTQASGGNCSTRASSNTSGQLSVESSAFDTALGVHGDSLASFNFRYTVQGNQGGVLLPLSFNFLLTGGLGLDGTTFGIADARIFLNASITDNTLSAYALNGIATVQGDRGSFLCTQGLGIFTGCGDRVAGSAFDIDYSLSRTLPFPIAVRGSGHLSAIVQGGTGPGPAGSGFANLSAQLVSVTLPADFTGIDPAGLRILLECGATLPVLQDSASAVPEPGGWLLSFTGAAIVLLIRRGRFSRQ